VFSYLDIVYAYQIRMHAMFIQTTQYAMFIQTTQ